MGRGSSNVAILCMLNGLLAGTPAFALDEATPDMHEADGTWRVATDAWGSDRP